ncbi:hypothetical protein M432DRAFT_679170 [Thermoascus aurantiacus ATCC 26904]
MVTKRPEINMCYACGAMIGVRAWCDHYLIPNVTCFDQPDYQLSGVGHFSKSTIQDFKYHVPVDKDAVAERDPYSYPIDAYYCAPEMTSVHSVATCPDQCPSEGCDAHGYPIHDACWTLIKRVIGPRVVEEHLGLFTEVLVERWNPKTFELERCVSNRTKRKRWVAKIGESGINYRDEHLTVRVFAHRDPIRIDPFHYAYAYDAIDVYNAVRDLIQEHLAPPSENRPDYAYCVEHLRAPGSGVCMPFELRYLILDHLGPADIRNAFRAFGWRVPRGYFRRRFPQDIIFEIEELSKSDLKKIDWEFLCLEMEKLMESSPGLLNRQRIFRILEDTKAVFLDRIEGQN